MQLLTDGSDNNPTLGFCLTMISQHGGSWPPTEEVLAREFVNWLDFHSMLTRSRLTELCRTKGVNLSFVPLPQEIRGFNCAFQEKKEIVITKHELAPFADSHTLMHEFRELLEHEFAALGYATIGVKDSLEEQAEIFAAFSRMEAITKDLPSFIEMAQSIEKNWARYLAYAFWLVFSLVYLFSCIYLPQLEEIGAEAKRQRYVRT